MYGLALNRAGSEPPFQVNAVALGILRKLASSPAGIYTPGLGYLQQLDNKLTWSKDFSNAAWVASWLATKAEGYIVEDTTSALHGVVRYTTWPAATAATAAYKVSADTATKCWVGNASAAVAVCFDLTTGTVEGTIGSAVGSIQSVGNGEYIVAVQHTAASAQTLALGIYQTFASGNYASTVSYTGTGKRLNCTAGALFYGTYTASQIASLGIPWTMGTASVSLSTPGADMWGTPTYTGESLQVSPGVFRIHSSAGVYSGASSQLTVTSGNVYQITLKIDAVTIAGFGIQIEGLNNQAVPATPGTYTFTLAATATQAVVIKRTAGATDIQVSSVQLKLVSSTSCPVYTDAPVYLPGAGVPSYGPEWATNGDFSQGETWWTFNQPTSGSTTVASGQLVLVNNDGSYSGINKNTLTVGKTYQVRLDVSSVTGNGVTVGVGGNYGGAITTPGVKLYVLQATTTTNFEVKRNSGAFTATIDNISVREVTYSSSSVSGLLTNNYTASDGPTGYSANDGVAGLVLDGMAVLGDEKITNRGPFTDTTGWGSSSATIAAVGGELVVTSTSASGGNGNITLPTTVNQTYMVTGVIRCGTAANVSLKAQSVSPYVALASSQVVSSTSVTAVQLVFTATTTSTQIYLQTAAANGVTAMLVAVSCKEISGIHATQSTTAAKPAERRGLYNLLKYSQDLSNAIWVKRGTCTVNSTPVAGPTGALNGYAVTGLNTGNNDLYQISAATAASGTLSPAIWIQKVSASGEVSIENAHTSDRGRWTVDLALIGSSWELIGVGHPAVTVANAFTSSTLDGFMVKGVSGGPIALNLCLAGLFQGALTAAQILAEGGIPLTTSAAASNPDAGKYWWGFDGNDSLTLGSVPFQATDDFAIVCGVNPTTSTTVTQRLFSMSGTTALLEFYVAQTSGVIVGRVKDDAAVDTFTSKTGSLFGAASVASFQKVTNTKNVRVNGAVGTVNTTATTTSTLTAASIGALPGPSNYLTGSIGPVILIKGTISDSDLLTLERWVASLTPNGPSF